MSTLTAAIAAAREEQREVDASLIDVECGRELRDASLTATPLADELAALRAQLDAAEALVDTLTEQHKQDVEACMRLERDNAALREAARNAMARCKYDCTVESYCGRCEPLALVLWAKP